MYNSLDPIDGTADVIDTREIIERIDYLETDESELDDDERTELNMLRAFRDDSEGDIPDWQYGEVLINSDYFTDYCKELVIDVGYLPADLPGWVVIDWEETADNMVVDYTEFELNGTTYYAR